MKKIILTIFALSITTIAIPVFSADPAQKKTECQIYFKKCADRIDTINHKINRIKTEIAKGNTKYSPEKLQKLNDKLEAVDNELMILLDKM